MKKLLLASSALAFAGSAFAADVRMPTKAPVPVAAPFTWNGCYVGAHAGYGWGEKGFSDPGLGAGFAIAPLGATAEVDTQGWLAGGQLGCNMQGGSWVLGIEADYAWANIDGLALDPFFANKNGDPQILGAETRGLGSVTGRVGYAFDRFLVYGKGGAAWANDRYDAGLFFLGFAGITNFTATETRLGWTVGAGVEYAFWDRWSVKLEYNHYEFGDQRVNLFDPVGLAIVPTDIDQRIDTVKIGINYRFWSL
jgi:outer membrane immunogenic protein